MRVVPIRAESARYAAPLLLVPDLWAGAESWAAMSGFLGHRGWEGAILDLRGCPGGLAARACAVADQMARQPAAPVIIGHGAGSLVALEAARVRAPLAVVLVAPLAGGSLPVRRLGWRLAMIVDLLSGADCRPPTEAGVYGGLPPRSALGPEDRETVLDVLRGRGLTPPGPGPRALVVAGGLDPVAPLETTERLARSIGADHQVVRGAGHWLIADQHWQATGAIVHRWLVQQLGEGLLELYAEAMAERDAADDD